MLTHYLPLLFFISLNNNYNLTARPNDQCNRIFMGAIAQTFHHPYPPLSGPPMEIPFAWGNNPFHPHLIF
jgi:hypothetical protein